MATTTTVQAPTVGEAQRAAECVAAAGAGRVLLFGSVACGRATAGSDIDLVAIFDDIDYSQRHGIRSVLCEAAESVVAGPVEVFVTDRAEWRRRTQEVSASFEAGIASSVVVLVDRPAGAVRWDKEIGLADNNTDEALAVVAAPAAAAQAAVWFGATTTAAADSNVPASAQAASGAAETVGGSWPPDRAPTIPTVRAASPSNDAADHNLSRPSVFGVGRCRPTRHHHVAGRSGSQGGDGRHRYAVGAFVGEP
ncbi:MAG: nucleotidyltransferase domain-containing protein, partial [Acidimicrobiaceae bacterium]|nr:nucleotidyltransferase domain-containing protein [Acidimicrobiaceae bacterium]